MADATLVRGIQPREVEQLWPRLLPTIQRGLRYDGGCFSPEDVKRSLIEGRRQLWVDWPALRCVLVTEQIDYPLKRVLHVFLAGGRLPRDWRAIWRSVEDWARSQGCMAIEIRGRPGWARRLPDYRARMIFLTKELT